MKTSKPKKLAAKPVPAKPIKASPKGGKSPLKAVSAKGGRPPLPR